MTGWMLLFLSGELTHECRGSQLAPITAMPKQTGVWWQQDGLSYGSADLCVVIWLFTAGLNPVSSSSHGE